ncbi:MAG: hypothetical protein VX218_11175, partial [Pseudomonadota bacterium]|nr:hypothetical protein [Pseudomonadota bacterium]
PEQFAFPAYTAGYEDAWSWAAHTEGQNPSRLQMIDKHLGRPFGISSDRESSLRRLKTGEVVNRRIPSMRINHSEVL